MWIMTTLVLSRFMIRMPSGVNWMFVSINSSFQGLHQRLYMLRLDGPAYMRYWSVATTSMVPRLLAFGSPLVRPRCAPMGLTVLLVQCKLMSVFECRGRRVRSGAMFAARGTAGRPATRRRCEVERLATRSTCSVSERSQGRRLHPTRLKNSDIVKAARRRRGGAARSCQDLAGQTHRRQPCSSTT
jgi:hypothetical protein